MLKQTVGASPAMMASNTHRHEWTCVSWFNKISDTVASKTCRFFGYAVATVASVITFIPSLVVDLGYAAKRLYDRNITNPQIPISNQVSASSIQSFNVTNQTPSTNNTAPFKLQRFLDAQNKGYQGTSTHATALQEMRNGKKTSHWIWYVLPNITGLGKSETTKHFALKTLGEVRAYYANETLKTNLIAIFQSINSHKGKTAMSIMGKDADKLKSCATIFYLSTKDATFKKTLEDFFDNKLCSETSKWYNANKSGRGVSP